MTYCLSNTKKSKTSSIRHACFAADEDLNQLLAPAILISAREIIRDRTHLPNVAGIYGWWFGTPLPGVPLDGTLKIGAHRLLYIGIAPRKPSAAGVASKSTLRRRITRNHLGNRIGSSTLRRSLAALLRSELALVIMWHRRKQIMSREHEALLTAWMINNAAISFMPHGKAWEVEECLVASGKPAVPLNLRGAKHEYGPFLRALRTSGLNSDERPSDP